MSELNPYAPPTEAVRPVGHASAPPAGGGYCWREWDRVVVPLLGGALPNRCVVCNEPASAGRIPKTMYWHPPALYVLLVLSPLVYLIVALITRKSATIALGVCHAHRARRTQGIVLGVLGLSVMLVLLVAAVASGTPVLVVPALLGLFGLPVAGMLMARLAYPHRIDRTAAWLVVGRPFLESIPLQAYAPSPVGPWMHQGYQPLGFGAPPSQPLPAWQGQPPWPSDASASPSSWGPSGRPGPGGGAGGPPGGWGR